MTVTYKCDEVDYTCLRMECPHVELHEWYHEFCEEICDTKKTAKCVPAKQECDEGELI